MNWFTELHTVHGDNKQWKLTEDFHYRGNYRTWSVPKGFETDLDSVPRIPIIYAMFKGRTTKAAVIHDWMYVTDQGKFLADAVFLEAMKAEGLKPWFRWPIYLAVTLFGWPIYLRKDR